MADSPSGNRVLIRAEQAADESAVRAILIGSFPTDEESRLVDALRRNANLLASLVAVESTEGEESEVVGHIAFSEVHVVDNSASGVGLAPLAVHEAHRRRGVAERLCQAGLEVCREAGYPFAVVLGEPGYYQRFGFRPATEWGLLNEYGAGDEFMALELRPGGLSGASGLVLFGNEFRPFSP
jgi:putative acetyltransferase